MRRFIAGAVCPQCRAMDRIVLEEEPARTSRPHGEPGEGRADATIRRRRCVSCGFSDTLATGAAAEPATRFLRRARGESPVTAVRIVDPAKPDR